MSEPVSLPSRPRRPLWIPPILGSVPDLTSDQLRLLGFVSLALCFENYDFSLLTAALPFIAESLDLGEAELGGFTGLIRLGALPAFLVVPFADRVGRRRVFLVSVVALSFGTLLTGFSQTATQFVLLQVFTRTFMLTAATVAFVMVSEELPAAHRGWGIGMLGALASLGHGLSALLFAGVEYLPFGWRSLYVIGIVPVLFLPAFRRGVPETERFATQEADQAGALAGYFEPFRMLVRRYPGRAAGIAALGFLSAASMGSAYQFTAQYLLVHRGWEPGQYSILVLTAGGLGVFGNILAGRLGDRIGRRRVGIGFVAVFPLLAWGFFRTDGFLIVLSWSLLVLSLTASMTILRAFATELFPTAYRGTSTGLQAMMETLGAAAGLGLATVGMRSGMELTTVLPLVSLLAPTGALVILTFPETRGRELESISE
ncbi:MAG: MFS transporter [Candidatus Binatia bacterium]|nr:MFS transporter [Candidatus Binatia bacterium]